MGHAGAIVTPGLETGTYLSKKAALEAARIGVEIYYPVPFHLQECFAGLGYKKGDFPESERAAAEVLSIPVYPELSDEQKDYVVNTIVEFYK